MRLPSPDSRLPFLNHVITGSGAPSGLQVMVTFPFMEALILDLSGCFSKVGGKAGTKEHYLTLSLPGRHSETTNNSVKSEILKHLLFLFRIIM